MVTGTTAGFVGGRDNVSDGDDDDDDWWGERIELPVAEATVTALSSMSGGTVGRASKPR